MIRMDPLLPLSTIDANKARRRAAPASVAACRDDDDVDDDHIIDDVDRESSSSKFDDRTGIDSGVDPVGLATFNNARRRMLTNRGHHRHPRYFDQQHQRRQQLRRQCRDGGKGIQKIIGGHRPQPIDAKYTHDNHDVVMTAAHTSRRTPPVLVSSSYKSDEPAVAGFSADYSTAELTDSSSRGGERRKIDTRTPHLIQSPLVGSDWSSRSTYGKGCSKKEGGTTRGIASTTTTCSTGTDACLRQPLLGIPLPSPPPHRHHQALLENTLHQVTNDPTQQSISVARHLLTSVRDSNSIGSSGVPTSTYDLPSHSNRPDPPESIYLNPEDVRMWSYDVGNLAHPRSCHGQFGHRPLDADADADALMWTARDFNWDEKGRRSLLGTGTFGEIFKATYRPRRRKDEWDGKTTRYAIKCLAKESIVQSQQSLAIVRREVEIQTRMHHQNIIRMDGYFHTRSQIFFVLEYANGGDLSTLLLRQQRLLLERADHGCVDDHDHGDGDCGVESLVATLPHNVAAHIVRSVAKALQYLRDMGVAHRDVKTENVLLNYPTTGDSGSKGTNCMMAEVKLCDFGWSVSCESPSSHIRTTLCGTPEYMAPEIVTVPPSHHSSKRARLASMVGLSDLPRAPRYDARFVDTWALGVMIYELLNGQTPFFIMHREGGSAELENEAIFESIRRFEDEDLYSLYAAPGTPDEWRQFGRLVRGLIRVNPRKRISLEQVLNHPWIKMMQDN